MGLCKSRSAAPVVVSKDTIPDPVSSNVPRKFEEKEVAKISTQPVVQLPTKSWRALLQEQPLNPDAEVFVPEQTLNPNAASFAPPLNPDVAPFTPSSLQATASRPADEPEWMQYLAKKASNAALTRSAGTAKSAEFPSGVSEKSGDRKLARLGEPSGERKLTRLGLAAKRAAAKGGNDPADPKRMPGDDEGSGGGGGIVLRTEAYLELLKQGPSKKKKVVNTNSANRTATNKTIAAPGKCGFFADKLGTEQTDVSTPMTSTNLVKKWSSALGKKAGGTADDAAQETTEQRVTQDDTSIAKLFIDKDLSDPGYYSETDVPNQKASASFHRFGRQPRLATRTYVMQDLHFDLDQAIGMLLNRLQSFTDWHKGVHLKANNGDGETQFQPHQERRFVIGLKEVARRVKQSKVECLIVAPDIEEDANSGGLDDRMRELLASAYQNRTPVVFALSRARLGAALGKSLHISVLGILDATGAKSLLRQSVQLAGEGRQAWLSRLEK